MLNPSPNGTIRVVVLPGSTVAGTKYFEETILDVSDDWAKHLIAQGVVRPFDAEKQPKPK